MYMPVSNSFYVVRFYKHRRQEIQYWYNRLHSTSTYTQLQILPLYSPLTLFGRNLILVYMNELSHQHTECA